MRTQHTLVVVALAAAVLASGCRSTESRRDHASSLLDDSVGTLRTLRAQIPAFDRRLADAKAIAIFPNVVKAGLVFAYEAGSGVLVARQPDGSWSAPTFLGLRAGSFGLQVGGQRSELALLVFDDAMLDRLASGEVALGADAGVTIGPKEDGVDEQASATTGRKGAESYLVSEGGFVGASVEGSVVKPRPDLLRAWYGRELSMQEVLRGSTPPSSSPGHEALHAALRRQ